MDFARLLASSGYASLRYDQPNSGNSEGDFLQSSFSEWVDTAVYLAKQYLDQGYEVALLGQSMGASTSVIASYREPIRNKISGLLLWVPDPKSTFNKPAEKVFEEGGQLYRGRFWKEARDANFFAALESFSNPIHLVYGEHDRYVEPVLIKQVSEMVQQKGQETLVLPGQDHSPWDPALCQKVYQAELAALDKAFS